MSASEKRTVLARVQADYSAIEGPVREIVEAVRDKGDEALVEYTARFDGVTLEPTSLRVSESEFDDAERQVSRSLRDALHQAHNNIQRHHREQATQSSWVTEVVPGVLSGERVTPIASTGLYVPRGKGSFPSVVLMLCTPAVIAGVARVAVCTPPDSRGLVDAASLVAARICGVDNVYRVGGPQAVAALAYGTETIPRVDKIVGPGNKYVSAAKRIVYGSVDPGLPAGPSESIILADDTADPQVVAREWLVEAEHGEDSAALLVTPSRDLAKKVEDLISNLVGKLPDMRQSFVASVLAGYGGILLTKDMAASLDFVNDYAPEHLRILTASPLELLPRVYNAGEILLGDYSSISFGNFSIGLNAILPTGGMARSYSCVGVHTFVKQSSFAYVSAEGARRIGPIAIELASWEGFPAHEEAARFAVAKAVNAEYESK